jgi:hypothetical protein
VVCTSHTPKGVVCVLFQKYIFNIIDNKLCHSIILLLCFVAVVRMFGASGVVVQIALALRHLFQRFIDSFYHRKLTEKLHRALGPNRIVFLINMLRGMFNLVCNYFRL